MKNIVTILAGVAIGLPAVADAGAANAQLRCKSVPSAGETLYLEGDIPGDFAEFSLVLRKGEASVEMTDRTRSDEIAAVTDWTHRVFTVTVRSTDGRRDLVLYALPRTVSIRSTRNGSRAEFKAVLQLAPIPGYKGPIKYDAFLHDVKMACTWNRSI